MGKETEPEVSAQGLALLRDALLEAQANVRAYDVKAQIVGVGYIFALGIVHDVDAALPSVDAIGVVTLVSTWVIVILPIILFGHVLYPSRRVAPDVEREAASLVRGILYSDPDDRRTVKEVSAAASAASPLDETAFELLKVSRLRDLKRRRFLRALFWALFSFIALFAGQVARLLAVPMDLAP